MGTARISEITIGQSEVLTPAVPAQIGLEQYYSEAGPDYAAWSPEFNMHFGYFRAGLNPMDREAMLEQMNLEVLTRLRLKGIDKPRLLDLGCGLGATLRSFARRLPKAELSGITRVPWQVQQAQTLNEKGSFSRRIRVIEGDYQQTGLPAASFDGVYALESSCHARWNNVLAPLLLPLVSAPVGPMTYCMIAATKT